MRLFYFPEFWVLLIAFLYMGSSIFYMIYNWRKKDKELDIIFEKYAPNVSKPRISKRYLYHCPQCFYISEAVVDNMNIINNENFDEIEKEK